MPTPSIVVELLRSSWEAKQRRSSRVAGRSHVENCCTVPFWKVIFASYLQQMRAVNLLIGAG